MQTYQIDWQRGPCPEVDPGGGESRLHQARTFFILSYTGTINHYYYFKLNRKRISVRKKMAAMQTVYGNGLMLEFSANEKL